jgi:Holliday junction resolvase-like predicted endonuclease
VGVRGETFAYWYLRRRGYVFAARNYVPRGAKANSIWSDPTETFVEVRTRTTREEQAALAELSVTLEKLQTVARTARRFLLERHVRECPMCFDVVAIEEVLGGSRSCACVKRRFTHRFKRSCSKGIRISKNLLK